MYFSKIRGTLLILTFFSFAGVLFGGSMKDGDIARFTLNRFLSYTLKIHIGGIPGEFERAILKPFLSEELFELLIKSSEIEDAHTEETKDGEPPYFEGNLFCSLFEGPTSFSITEIANENDRIRGEVSYEYYDNYYGREERVTWNDEFILIKTQKGWVVDDIFWGGKWEFMHKGNLKGMLSKFIKENSRENK